MKKLITVFVLSLPCFAMAATPKQCIDYGKTVRYMATMRDAGLTASNMTQAIVDADFSQVSTNPEAFRGILIKEIGFMYQFRTLYTPQDLEDMRVAQCLQGK